MQEKMQVLLWTLAAVAIFTTTSEASKARVVCYYTKWAVYRPLEGSYSTEDIPVEMCTHVIYSFIGITENNEVRIQDPELDVRSHGFQKFTNLRKSYRDVKFTVAVGGWSEGGEKFSKMASQSQSRQTFIKSLVEFINKYDFDGLDLDWEYPGYADRGGIPADKYTFYDFVYELRQAFNNVNKNWELTMAAPIHKSRVEEGYRVADLCSLLDAVHLMAYDLRGVSPLSSGPHNMGVASTLNVNGGLAMWQQKGCPANKLILGVPFYGRSFTLAAGSTNYGIGAPIAGTGGEAGEYTQAPGLLAYYEICTRVENKGWTKDWSEYGQCPFAYKGQQWVGYEDPQSLELKMNFIKERGYGGAMIWAIDLDDFRGICGSKHALLNVIYTNIKNYNVL